MSLNLRWQLLQPEEIAILRFEDEALVFNPATWETHLLNEAASIVLDSLTDGPRSVDEIVKDVVGVGEVTVPEGFAEQVGELLGQFVSIGLVISRQ